MRHVDCVVLTCEHGGNRVPQEYGACFRAAARTLATHRGLDIGALALARDAAGALGTGLHACTVTRLLVDCNRSRKHPRLFSEFSRRLSRAQREEALERFWRAYREPAEAEIAAHLKAGRRVLHLSIHSFTPVFNGKVRPVDIGLLHDPGRPRERALCAALREELRARLPGLRIFYNRPYTGTSDGFGAAMRTTHPASKLLAIEIEVNQRFAIKGGAMWARVRAAMCDAWRAVLDC